MINNTQLQIKFRQRLNKLASNDFDNIECWQIVEAFNKAQREWVRRQLRGTNHYKDGNENSIRRIDDLQLLLVQSQLNGQNLPGLNCWAFGLPGNYMEFKRVDARAYSECCPSSQSTRPLNVYLAEEESLALNMRNTLTAPSFEWGETFCTMQGNTLRLYYRSDEGSTQPFSIDGNTVVLTYYREPTAIQIEGCTDPVDGDISAQDIPCQFKDDVAELIIDEAVSIIAGDINDVNQYMRGSANAEKNN
tara:strand:- start:588 stop:1331 length:744 start_codon:yes stop_codon:yes gene_type:complete